MDLTNKSPAEIDELLVDKNEAELLEIYDQALKLLPSRAPIYLPTEKIPLRDKIKGVEHVRRIYRQDLGEIYQPRLRELREQFKGKKRCFLIGNGPSLNKTDLSVLKDEVTFAVNGFFLKAEELDWTPTFYCVEDHLVAEDRAKWINEFKGPIKFFPAYLGYMFPPAEDTVFYNHRPRVSYPDGFDFSMEADKITYTGCTVTFSLMQLATYLGFEEIYLIGVDASYDIPADAQEGDDYNVGVLDMKSDDPNHFNPDYFGKGFRWHDPQVELMVEAYKEAHKTLKGTGQTIYNATIGGMLEVFERRSFAELFPKAMEPEKVGHISEEMLALRPPKGLPKLLVLDMTAMGNGSATGEVKSSLLGKWSDDNLLQVASPAPDKVSIVRPENGGFHETKMPEDAVREAIEEFHPDVILYRPLADRPALHNLAMSLISESNLPLVTWIMDDWPARLKATDPEKFAPIDKDLRLLLNKADLNLSISDAMSVAFEKRYNVPFKAYANGINPTEWAAPKTHKAGTTIVRYAGGLAPDMNAEAVQRVALAIEALAEEGVDIRFEINTQPWWLKQSGDLFDGLKFTTLTAEKFAFEDYINWLQTADVLLIAYNFDEESLRYVRYSMANKLPECLISGAALLVHGPNSVATVETVEKNGVGMIVQRARKSALMSALEDLCDPATRQKFANRAHKLALKNYSLPILAGKLAKDISQTHTRPSSSEALYFLYTAKEAEPVAAKSGADFSRRLGKTKTGLIVYDDPVVLIADALEEGIDFAPLLSQWQDNAKAALDRFKRKRSQVFLFESAELTRARAASIHLLLETLPGKHLPREMRAATQTDPLLYTVAWQYLLQNQTALQLLNELHASSLRPNPSAIHSGPTPSDVLQRFHQLQQSATSLLGTQPMSKTARNQVRLLEAQVEQLTQTSQMYYEEIEALQANLHKRNISIGRFREESDALRRRGAELNRMIADQKSENDAQSRAIKALQSELAAVYSSKSWRITSIMRRARAVFTKKKDE